MQAKAPLDARFLPLLQEWQSRPDVLGVDLHGSRGAGRWDEHSDYDLVVLVPEGSDCQTLSARLYLPQRRWPVYICHQSEECETPADFELDAEFHFNTDVAALQQNAKCDEFYTPGEDGLKQTWSDVCWCNPPYGAWGASLDEEGARECSGWRQRGRSGIGAHAPSKSLSV